jgi:adenine-specific DNA-methyltransferase
VAEDEPLEREVAIDPEMLGKVFENLLEVKDRRAKGTYYTPREIVHYMCQESLTACLASKCPSLDRGELEDFIRYGDLMLEHDAKVLTAPTPTYKDCFLGETIREYMNAVDEALKTVKICDPAIGSGAFPVGMMTEIVRARKVLAMHLAQEEKPYGLKRQTIQECPYGVDLDPGAIEIAKLRLWLSLVVDEDDFNQIQALPNLDYKIMQGNSLLQTFEGIRLFDDTLLRAHDNNIRRRKQLEGDMRELQAQLMAILTRPGASKPTEKKGLEKAIQQKQKDINALSTTNAVDKTAAPLLDAQTGAKGLAEELKDLHTRFFTTPSAKEKKLLRERIEALETRLIETSLRDLHREGEHAGAYLDKIRALQRRNVKPYFLWKLHFSEVFLGDSGGFDIVIANPPYVRHEGIKDQKPALKIEFPDFFKGTADLYTYFYRRGIELLSPTGHLCFIAPNKFFKAGYGENLRRLMTSQVRLMKVLDFGELPVFDAGTDPSILMIEKSEPVQETTFAAIKRKEDLSDLVNAIGKAAKQIDIADLSPSGWNFSIGADRDLLVKIEGAGIPLGQFVEGKFYYGIKTGLNEAFVIDAATRARLIAEDPSCAGIIKPWLNGKEIQRWYDRYQDKHLIFTRHGIDICKYPSVKKYLEKYQEDLKPKALHKEEENGRKPGSYKWYEIQDNIAYYDEFDKPKIVYNETSKKLHAFFDTESLYINKTGFIILCDDAEFLLGIMNSNMMDFYFRSTFPAWGDPWNGGRVQFRGDRMERLPIAQGSKEIRKRMADTVTKITNLKKQNPAADVTALEAAINAEVYKLYALTPAEIALIESATKDAQMKAA